MRTPVKCVALVASRSGTGKTTLLEALVTRLKGKGFRVGAVKHSGHGGNTDREGSDSWRITRAGADVTVLAGEDMYAVFSAWDMPPLDHYLDIASKNTDIVLVEGFKETTMPKIELFRSGYSRRLYSRRDDFYDQNLIAVASDVPLEVDVPLLDLNDPNEVCEFVVEQIINNDS